MVNKKQLKATAKNNNIEELLETANKVGIINISAGGTGLSERIVKDAINTAEFVKNYFAEHRL